MSEELNRTTDSELVCKRCGRPHMDKDIEVSEDVLKDYTRCALGGTLFTKTFKLLDGELLVKMSALPAEFELTLRDLSSLEISGLQSLDIRLLLSLEEIRVFDADTSGLRTVYSASLDERKEFLEDPKKALKELSSKIDAVLLGVLRRVSATFILLQNAILEALINTDFYEGVGLV